MIKKATQKEKVIAKLNADGEVSNFWAMSNYLLRLGARISDLKSEGWEFEGSFGEGPYKKNFTYKVLKNPTRQKESAVV